jgi:putative endonuclease
MKKKLLGKLGELIVKKYLLSKKHKCIKKNFHSRYGEIDLIFKNKEGDQLVFCEVKSRTSEKFSKIEESLTKRQIQKITNTIFVFLEKNRYNNISWRLDLFLILFDLKNSRKK